MAVITMTIDDNILQRIGTAYYLPNDPTTGNPPSNSDIVSFISEQFLNLLTNQVGQLDSYAVTSAAETNAENTINQANQQAYTIRTQGYTNGQTAFNAAVNDVTAAVTTTLS